MWRFLVLFLMVCITACAQNPQYVNSLIVGGGPDDADGGSALNSDGSAEFSGDVEAGSFTMDGSTLGTMSVQDADDVAIIGGSVTGLSDFSTADTSITLGTPNLTLPSFNSLLFAPSTGDGTAGSMAFLQGCNGADGTTGAGGAGGGMLFIGPSGGDAAGGSNANGGAGGTQYFCGGAGGAGDGTGVAGVPGNAILAYNPIAAAVQGKTGIGMEVPLTTLDIVGNMRTMGRPAGVLTGSINPTASTSVVGVGTKFTTELVVNDRITVNGETRKVTVISSDTALTVDSAFTDTGEDTAVDLLYAIANLRDSTGATKFSILNTGDATVSGQCTITSSAYLQSGGYISGGYGSTGTTIASSTGAISANSTIQADGAITSGLDSTAQGSLTLWDGGGTNTPGYVRMASADGGTAYLFNGDDDVPRYHTSAPTSGTAGKSIGGETVSAFAAGSVYVLTNSSAAFDFSTTDPAITLTKPGTYLIIARAQTNYAIATTALNNTVTAKIRRTNNTAADLTNGTVTAIGTAMTDYTGLLADQTWQVLYTTTNTDDAIAMYGHVSVAPTGGDLWVTAASIIAVLLY